MKNIIRILLILLVAGVLCGALYLFSNTNVAAALTPERGGHGPHAGFQIGEDSQEHGDSGERNGERAAWGERSGDGSGVGNFNAEGDRSSERGGHHHEDSLSLASLLAGLAKHIALIALVVLVVVAIQKIAGMVGRKQAKPAASVSE